MFGLLKALGYIILALIAAVGVLWVVGPYEPADMSRRFDASQIGDDIDAYLAAEEAKVEGITPGAEKSVVWAGSPGEKTDLAIVYLHGFSASPIEARPVPERVASSLGANLVRVRLKGHGRDGAAMATATVADWVRDMDEALAIADRIADRTIVLGVSTGATLVSAGLVEDRADQIDGVVMMSPNFKVRNPLAVVLEMPAVRYWGPVAFGAERSWEPHNEEHARGWTTTYPTVATLPMAAMVKAARETDYSDIQIPVLMLYASTDQVIDPDFAKEILAGWGGPVTLSEHTLTSDDDPSQHLLAGDALSPARNTLVAEEIIAWIEGL